MQECGSIWRQVSLLRIFLIQVLNGIDKHKKMKVKRKYM